MEEPVTLNQAMLDRMPIKECGSRFCLNSGPATSLQIFSQGSTPDFIVGFCAICRRYLCGQCAIARVVLTAGDGQGTRLHCRYCGLSLGAETGSLLIPMEIANDPTKIKERLPKPDDSELRDSEWVKLYRDVVNRGVIKTIGIQKAEAALTSAGSKKGLALLEKEELLCQRAGYEAGLAHCATKKGIALVDLNRHRQALNCATEASAIWRRVGNRNMLARSLFAEYFLLFGKHFLNKPNRQTPEAKLNQLQEMWDAARGIEPRIVELAISERTKIHLNRGDLVNFVTDLSQASDGTKKVEDFVNLWVVRQQDKPPRLRIRTTDIDDNLIHRMRSNSDVWGCPKGCKPAGTMGVVGIPKEHTIPNFPCPSCGTHWVCLNNYSRVKASISDEPQPGILKRKEFTASARLGIVYANFSLLLQDDERLVAAPKLQEMAINEWSQRLGNKTADFAKCLDEFAGELLTRDEHEAGLELCRRALNAAETLDHPVPQLHASILTKLGISLACLGDYDRAERALRQALELNPALATPYYWLAKVYFYRGEIADPSLEAAAWNEYCKNETAGGPRRAEAEARLAALGACESESQAVPGSLPSLEVLKRTAESLRASADDEGLLACLEDLFVEARRTENGALDDIAIEMEQVARRLNRPTAILSALSRRAEMLAEGGDETSLSVWAECETLARQLSDRPALAACLLAQARLHEQQDRQEQAAQKCDEAAAIYTELQDTSKVLICLRQLTRIRIDQKQWSTAASRAQALTRLTRFLDNSSELIEALLQEARIQQEIGEHYPELEIYNEIVALCRRDDYASPLIDSLCRQSELLLEAGADASESIELLTEAFELCKPEIAQLVVRDVPQQSPEYQTELNRRQRVLRCFDSTCRGLMKSGQLGLAISSYEHTIQLRKTALDSTPGDHGLRFDLVAALDELGLTLLQLNAGDRRLPTQYFQQALSELQQLHRPDLSVEYATKLRSLRDEIVSHLADARRKGVLKAYVLTFLQRLRRGVKDHEHR